MYNETIIITVMIRDLKGKEVTSETHIVAQPRFDELPPKFRKQYLFEAIALMRRQIGERLNNAG
jgi:hypothetical protein